MPDFESQIVHNWDEFNEAVRDMTELSLLGLLRLLLRDRAQQQFLHLLVSVSELDALDSLGIDLLNRVEYYADQSCLHLMAGADGKNRFN
jgi:hypothetical protein